jgi:citrate lyase subunit beta/citryl-CoA lyase
MTEIRGPIAPLFVPADRPERFAKAAASGADAVIIDLEDAVPAASKEAARAALATALPAAQVIVRVNAIGTSWHDGDIDLIHRLGAVGVMLPKAEDPEAVASLAHRLRGHRHLIALVETALGVHRAIDIAAVHGVTQLAFGPADYQNDVGCGDAPEALLLARSTLVLASRLAWIAAPLDGPCFDFRDAAKTAEEARYARTLGFGGKLCIHPNQVPWVKEAFRPTDAEIAWARRVVATEGSGGAANLDGTMIDAPVVARARRILHHIGS